MGSEIVQDSPRKSKIVKIDQDRLRETKIDREKEPLRIGKTGRFTRANPAKNVHFARANQAKNVQFARVVKPNQKCSFYPHAQLSDGDELTCVTIRTHSFWGGRTNM